MVCVDMLCFVQGNETCVLSTGLKTEFCSVVTVNKILTAEFVWRSKKSYSEVRSSSGR